MYKSWKEFNAYAMRIVACADEKAKMRGHGTVGPEHLLLALLDNADTPAHRLIIGIYPAEKLIEGVDYVVGPQSPPASGQRHLSQRAGKVIETAAKSYLDYELDASLCLLEGLLSEGDSVAAGILEACGVTLETAHLTHLKV